MEVKDFLEKLDGAIHIKIIEFKGSAISYNVYRYNNAKKAIEKHDQSVIKSWTIENNVLVINI